MIRFLRWSALAFAYLVSAIAALWAVGALYFDLPWAALRGAASILLAFAFVSALIFLRGSWRKLGAIFTGFALVLAWWLTLKPSNEANWQPDVAQTRVGGDQRRRGHPAQRPQLRLPHRDRLHRRIGTRAPCASRRSPASTWPSTTGAHRGWRTPSSASSSPMRRRSAFPSRRGRKSARPIPPSAASIGSSTLIYIVAEERDVIRVRTNYRQAKTSIFTALTATPAQARERFHEYLRNAQPNPRPPALV